VPPSQVGGRGLSYESRCYASYFAPRELTKADVIVTRAKPWATVQSCPSP
jgi:hypothetical protein